MRLVGPPLAAVALLAAVARADGDFRRHRSEDGKYSIELPALWTITSEGHEPTEPLRLQASVPGVDGDIVVSVWLLQGQRDPGRQACVERDQRKTEPKTVSAKVETTPFPHLLCHYRTGDGRERMEAVAYSMVRRNGIAVMLRCPIAAWPALRDTFLRAARSVVADIEEWPKHPPDFRRESKEGFVYLVHPKVKPAKLKDVHAIVRRVRERFEELHGRILTPAENPPLIVVLRSLDDGKGLHDMKDAAYGTALHGLGGRLFLTPPAGDATARAACAQKVFQLMFIQRYGSTSPYWMFHGEGRIFWSEEITGKKAPEVDSHLYKDLSTPAAAFVELAENEAKRSFEGPFRANAAAYVMLFREGPAKYRKAYEAFKDDVGDSHDIVLALDKHLLSLDQATMKRDLGHWIASTIRDADRK